MEYQYIVNPKTGRKCNVNSKTGRQVIQNYAQEGGLFKSGMKGRIRNNQEPVSINKKNTTGGGIIGDGTYGCILRPNLKCGRFQPTVIMFQK